jgi:hypothetical protein
MPLQYISDASGNHTAVVIPIEEWKLLLSKCSELQSLESRSQVGPSSPKPYTMDEFIGKLSPEAAEALQNYTQKSRDEWERDS